MDISVVIPAFNRAHTISRAVDSVLAQTCRPCELVVVDDGSDDGTVELLQGKYPEIRVLFQENKGVSAARNAGIENACGDWIAFLDSDDEWKPNKLELQINAVMDNDRCLACHTDEIWMRKGKRVNPMHKHAKPDGWIFENCLPLCCVSPSSILLHRSVFEEFGRFDETLPVCEDYDLWLRIFSILPIVLVRELLVVKYGGHVDQLSKKYWGMDRFRIVALEKLLDNGNLSDAQQEMTGKVLKEKLTILKNGSAKRGKSDETGYYQQKLDDLCSI